MVIHRTAFSSFAVLCERYNLIMKIDLSFSTCIGGRDVLLHPVPSCAPISSCLRDPGGRMWVLDPVEWQSLPLSPSPSRRLPGWLARGPHPGVGAQLHPSDGALCFPSETRARRCSQEEEDLARDPKSLAGSLTRSGSCLPSQAVPSHCKGGTVFCTLPTAEVPPTWL